MKNEKQYWPDAKFLSLAGDQKIKVCELQIKSFAEIEIGQCPFEEIDATAKMHFVPDKVFKSPVIAGFK